MRNLKNIPIGQLFHRYLYDINYILPGWFLIENGSSVSFQVYLQGEFFAGCDIMYEAYQKDELRKELLDAQMTLPAVE